MIISHAAQLELSSEKDPEGSFGETGGHKKKEQRCDRCVTTRVTSAACNTGS